MHLLRPLLAIGVDHCDNEISRLLNLNEQLPDATDSNGHETSY